MMQQRPPQRPLRVTLDFDGTLTKQDTTVPFASVAYRDDARGTQGVKLKPWSYFSDAFMKDYEAHVASYTPRAEDRKTIDQEIAWLVSLQGIEEASFARAKREGVFDHVGLDEVHAQAQDAITQGAVVLRPGWCEFVLQLASICEKEGLEYSWDVLSVNWSRQWIRRCLVEDAERRKKPNALSTDWKVYANEICGRVDDGELTKLHTSRDKVQRYASNIASSRAIRSKATPVTVYIGDSTGDFDCLLSADVGVCIRDDPQRSGQQQLSETFQRLQVEVRPLAYFNAKHVREVLQMHHRRQLEEANHEQLLHERQPRLWWVNSFDELSIWIQNWTSMFCTEE